LTQTSPNQAIKSDMTLTLHQDRCQLSGQLTLGAPFRESGPVVGPISQNGHVTLTVNFANGEIDSYTGNFASDDHALSGTYTTTHGYTGIWYMTNSSS
jgi:hypothetical protein